MDRHNACNGSISCFKSNCILCERNMIKKLHDLPTDSLGHIFQVLMYNTPKKHDDNPRRECSSPRKRRSSAVSMASVLPFGIARRLTFNDPLLPEIARQRANSSPNNSTALDSHLPRTPIRRNLWACKRCGYDGGGQCQCYDLFG